MSLCCSKTRRTGPCLRCDIQPDIQPDTLWEGGVCAVSQPFTPEWESTRRVSVHLPGGASCAVCGCAMYACILTHACPEARQSTASPSRSQPPRSHTHSAGPEEAGALGAFGSRRHGLLRLRGGDCGRPAALTRFLAVAKSVRILRDPTPTYSSSNSLPER